MLNLQPKYKKAWKNPSLFLLPKTHRLAPQQPTILPKTHQLARFAKKIAVLSDKSTTFAHKFHQTFFETRKSATKMGDVLSGEFTLSQKCKHRICLDKCSMGYTQTLIQTERANTQDEKSCMSALFSVSDVFANAKVMLCYA